MAGGLISRRGARHRRLHDFLRRRMALSPDERRQTDRRRTRALFRRQAIVFTDTADFTVRAVRDGILHFLMLLERAADGLQAAVAGYGGDIVKVEADSLLLRFPDLLSACRGVAAMERHLRGLNRGLPVNERLRFSYGIGWGDVLDLEDDVFGLEVNLASKLGEDLARPGEVLLTPAAAAALDGSMRRRLRRHAAIRFGSLAVPVYRLPLPKR